MKPEFVRARRYLLQQDTEDDGYALERDYFASAETLDQVSAAEEDLIDQYLDDELSPEERTQFESAYLAAPHRRQRVETIRSLRTAARARAAVSQDIAIERPIPLIRSSPLRRKLLPLAVAAAVTLVSGVTIWRLNRAENMEGRNAAGGPTSIVAPPAQQPAPGAQDTPTRQRIVTFSLSPIATRSSGEARVLTLAAGIDLVALHLEADAALALTRVTLATVAGAQIWEGRVGSSDKTSARVEIPAALLAPEDYLVTLYSRSSTGREEERHRYFLPVRK